MNPTLFDLEPFTQTETPSDDIGENGLPSGWELTSLGQILEFKYGKSLPDKTRDGIGFSVYGSNGVVGRHSTPLVEQIGLIIGRKGSVGEVQLSDGPFFPIDTTYYVDAFFHQPIHYWFYYLKFLPLTEMNRSTAIPGLNREDAYNLITPLPPLAEQHQIAARLDTLLAQVDSLKARLDGIPALLKTFRQSVLAAAVSGKLTEGWREKHSLLLDDWNHIQLENIANIIDPHPSHRTPPVHPDGVPYIGIGDLSEDGTINFESARKVSPEVLIEHKNRYSLKKGDFVFGKIGTLGKATILPMNIEYTLSANVILIQPLEEKVNSIYMIYLLSSPLIMLEIESQSNSTSQAAFGIKKMRAFNCDIPPLPEQTEIVRRVETLFAFADTVEARVQAAQAQVNQLTQSILAKAFRGELTADWRKANPELISGDNSAAALLERIQAERQAQATSKSAGKTKKSKQT